MAFLNAAAVLIVLAALFSWFNHRFIRLPATIALLLFSLATSVGVFALGKLGFNSEQLAYDVLQKVQLDHALLNGMVSPPAPISVRSILKSAQGEKSLEMKMAGEALLNDGLAVVLFVVLLGIATGGEKATVSNVLGLFTQEVLGGALFGLAIGYVAYR